MMRAGRLDCFSQWRGLCAGNTVKCSHGSAILIISTFDLGMLRFRSWTWEQNWIWACDYSWSYSLSWDWGLGWNIEYCFGLSENKSFSIHRCTLPGGLLSCG